MSRQAATVSISRQHWQALLEELDERVLYGNLWAPAGQQLQMWAMGARRTGRFCLAEW